MQYWNDELISPGCKAPEDHWQQGNIMHVCINAITYAVFILSWDSVSLMYYDNSRCISFTLHYIFKLELNRFTLGIQNRYPAIDIIAD